MRTRRRTILLGLIVASVLVALIVWRLSWLAPSWYRPPNVHDEQVQALADRVEYRMLEEAQKIRPRGERWSLRIGAEHVNLWLAARLPQWIAHEADSNWPEQLGMPQIHIQADGLSVALPLKQENRQRTIVARLAPSMHNGKIVLQLNRIAIGRIGLPGEPLENLLELAGNAGLGSVDDPTIKAVRDVLSGRTLIDPVIKLADGRHVRLLDFKLGQNSIDITAQTE